MNYIKLIIIFIYKKTNKFIILFIQLLTALNYEYSLTTKTQNSHQN